MQVVVGRLVSCGSLFRIRPTLAAQLLQRLRALFERHAVVVALGHDSGHVVHGAGHDGLDALVHGDGTQGHAAPAANADDADPLAVDGRVQAEIVDGGAEILGIDVRRSDVARLAAAFSGIGPIESHRDEATLRHRLRVKARRLFLHRTKRATDGKRRQAPVGPVLGQIQVARQGDAVAVLEGDLLMIDLLASGEGLVPSGRALREGL